MSNKTRGVGCASESNRKPQAEPMKAAPDAMSDHDPLEEFQGGQWWVRELDAMARADGATDDQKRAVAVVHNFLRGTAALSTTTQQAAKSAAASDDELEAIAKAVGCEPKTVGGEPVRWKIYGADLRKFLLALAAHSAAPAAVGLPAEASDAMCEAAMEAHYGIRRVRVCGGARGIDMTVDDHGYNGLQAFRRMWRGAMRALAAPMPATQAPAAVGLVPIEDHNRLTAGPAIWTATRVPLAAFNAACATYGTTSEEDDRRVYRTLQAAFNAAGPTGFDEPTDAMVNAMVRRLLLNKPDGSAWEDVMRLAYLDARAIAKIMEVQHDA